MKKFIVLLAVIAMVGAFTATAIADVSLYGSARFGTYSVDSDKEFISKAFDDRDTEWRMWNLSRFGATFKGDKVDGKFEMDARINQTVDNTDGGTGVGTMRLRLLYGSWDFGSGKLMIGQNYPLYNFAISSVAYTTGGLQQWGGVASATPRLSQIRLTFGDLKLAFLTPNTKGTVANDQGTYDSDMDAIFPKIELEYDLKLDNMAFQSVGGYQSVDAVNAADDNKNVTSYVAAASGKFNFGPAYLNAALSYRVNGSNYGVWTAVDEAARFEGGDFQDATTFGFAGALGFKVNDMFTLEASAGYLSADYDTAGSAEDTARSYALLAKITLAPGVMIVPEYVVLDKDKIKDAAGIETDQGKQTAIGVWWIINFK